MIRPKDCAHACPIETTLDVLGTRQLRELERDGVIQQYQHQVTQFHEDLMVKRG